MSDSKIHEALTKLRLRLQNTEAATVFWKTHYWLEDDEEHNHIFYPSDPDIMARIAQAERDGLKISSDIEALYREMNGLWTGPKPGPGDDHLFSDLDLVIHSLMTGRDGLVKLNCHSSDFQEAVMYEIETGRICLGSTFDPAGELTELAPSLVVYLERLAETYGLPFAGQHGFEDSLTI